MDKFTFKTADGIDVNLEKLSRAFPEVITETMGEDGKIKRVADFEKLKMLLGDSAAERPQEFYEFTWPGKNEAIMKAAEATKKTLRPCVDESKNWDTTQNLYIEGDNLEALKILQESYLGKVKMIYIDPPYNTGKDFVYRDKYCKSAAEGKEDEIKRDEETNDNLFQNTESNGRFHSDWCTMIYPRLKLARDLLRDDGVIFISIDDNEVHNLRKICDEVFGEDNFVAQVIWETRANPVSMSNTISDVHEYILMYQKTNNFEIGLFPRTSKQDSRYKNPDNDPRGPWTSGDLTCGPVIPNKVYDLITPSGRVVRPANGLSWIFSKERMKEVIKENRVYFGENGDNMPRYKRFLKDVKQGVVPTTLWKFSDIGGSMDSVKEQKKLFDGIKIFDFPKTVSLLKQILIISNSANGIILDFFSGSATTAHACMQLNAEDGGNRKFIMVQLPEVCAPDSEAAKAGYKNICEIGKERIRRAGEKIKAEHATTAPNLDIGFRVLKIDESIMKDVFYSPNETSQDLLSTLESNIKEDRTDLDLLFACLVDWGVELSMPLKMESIDGVEIHTMNDGDAPALVACFAQNIPETVVRKIAARHPIRAVFRDSSFADSPAKINLTEIFKTYSPETEVKVL